MNKMTESTKRTGRKPVFGIILVLIGFFLIANQFDLFPRVWSEVIFTWQTFVLLLGVILVTTRDNKATGYVLMIVGGFFLIPEIFDVPMSFGKLFWPLLFILAGFAVLFGHSFRKRYHRTSGEDTDYIDDVNILGGHDRIVTGSSFRGGNIVSFMGGGTYDMRQCNLSHEENTLSVVNVFGGSSLIVPPEWDVKVDVIAIFGGFSDKRVITKTASDRVLIIKGIALFGGGEIKSEA